MGCGSICRCLAKTALFLAVIAAALIFIPNLPPYASFQESYSTAPVRPLTGKLALNERLAAAEPWGEPDTCPEAFAVHRGVLYGGLATGEVVKYVGEKAVPVARTGRACRGRFEERICGRPLGMQFDKEGALYVADAYYGILKVDVKTGDKEVIVSPDTKIDGKEPKLFNSLVLASNGDIYWSDSSTDFGLDDGLFAALADASGRLVHYDAKTRKNRVLVDKLHFANGVIISEDESEILVSDLFRTRIIRYYLKGPKAGQHDVFVDGLPGYPDNLNYDGKGGYLVALVTPGDEQRPLLTSVLGPFPLIRKLLARLMGVPKMAFEMIDRAYPNDFSLKAIHLIGHFAMADPITSKYRSTIIQLSKTGEILDSIHTTTKTMSICEAFIHKDTLYLGSPFESRIGRVKLSEVGWAHLAQSEPEKSKQTSQTPPTQNQAPPPQKQTAPTLKQAPPQADKTTTLPKQTSSQPKPSTDASSTGKEQTKTVPVKENVKTK